MFGWRFGLGLSLVGLTMACGGEADRDPHAMSGGAAGFATSGGGSATGGAAGTASGGATSGGQAMTSGGTPFVDPGCPTAPPPPGIVECDPLAPESGCGPGFACYPYVEHPYGRGCDAESSGALCRAAGTGIEGSLCGLGTPGCASGHICVVGARAGRRCAKLCRIDALDTCSNGTVCQDTDVQGYGVCN